MLNYGFYICNYRIIRFYTCKICKFVRFCTWKIISEGCLEFVPPLLQKGKKWLGVGQTVLPCPATLNSSLCSLPALPSTCSLHSPVSASSSANSLPLPPLSASPQCLPFPPPHRYYNYQSQGRCCSNVDTEGQELGPRGLISQLKK